MRTDLEYMTTNYDSKEETENLTRKIRECAQKFKSPPRSDFLGHVVNVVRKYLNLDEASYYLMRVPKDYDTFPSLSDIERDCGEIYKKKNFAKQAAKEYAEASDWVSKRAPGTPAPFEAIFNMILNGKSNSGAFKWAVRHTGLIDEEIWAAYTDWCEGKVHPVILNRKIKLMGKTFG